jgi:L-iditol 2-dehydrogenase
MTTNHAGGGQVQAIQYRFSLAAFARTLLLRRAGLTSAAVGSSPLRLVRMPAPPLPGPDWLRVRLHLAGVCGSDLGLLRADLSPALSPFASFPAVLGHEGVGEVVAAGPEVPWPVGTRVVWDPFLGCRVRGLDPCPSCASGVPALCRRVTEGRFAPGLILGTCRDLPGTWSEEILLHESQVFPVPDDLDDARAVLVEPLAVAAHAVLKTPPPPGAPVFIVGAGTIGLMVVAALRILGFANPVAVAARHPRQAALARTLGADVVLPAGEGVAAVAHFLDEPVHKALDGTLVLKEGLPLVFDAVGTAQGLELALGAAGRGGTVNLVGSPGLLRRVDATAIWAREVTVTGSLGYGREHGHEGVHTFALVLDRLSRHPELPLAQLISHRLPLTEVRAALALLARPHGEVVKLVLTPEGSSER